MRRRPCPSISSPRSGERLSRCAQPLRVSNEIARRHTTRSARAQAPQDPWERREAGTLQGIETGGSDRRAEDHPLDVGRIPTGVLEHRPCPVRLAQERDSRNAKRQSHRLDVLRGVARCIEGAPRPQLLGTRRSGDTTRVPSGALQRFATQDARPPGSSQIHHHDVARASLGSENTPSQLRAVREGRRLSRSASDDEQRWTRRVTCP